MIKIINTRLVVQRDNTTKDKYYPKVISATTSYAYPFSIPTATIDIVTNTMEATDGYISPVRVDDIVRLQVSVKYNPNEKTVWEDIFEGRVRDISSPFSDRNTSTLLCVGHVNDAATNTIDSDSEWSNATDAADIISELVSAWLSRINYFAGYVDTGAEIEYFNIAGFQRYVSDAFGDLEKLAKFHYFFSVVTEYDTLGNLANCYIRWRHFPLKVTNKYAVIEGSEHLLSAEFKSSAEELWNYFRVFGESVAATDTTSESQYTGAAKSSKSIAKYSWRCKAMTVTGIDNNYMCANIAAAMVQRFKNPIVSGTATLTLTPNARLGDLVHVKLPSLEINGAYVDRNYHVYKIDHKIDSSGATTTLDFTKVKKKPEDYIADYAKQQRVNNANDITSSNSSTLNEQDGVTDTGDTSDTGDSGYTDTSSWSDNIDYSSNEE